MKYRWTPFHEVGQEIAKLSRQHWEDSDKTQNGYIVDWLYYLDASSQNVCWVASAWKLDKLAGYMVFFILQDPNCRSVTEAHNSMFYVLPQYRGKITRRLVDYAERQISGTHASKIKFSLSDPRVGKLMKRLGYEPLEVVWGKKI